jgi:hypothetical protein
LCEGRGESDAEQKNSTVDLRGHCDPEPLYTTQSPLHNSEKTHLRLIRLCASEIV